MIVLVLGTFYDTEEPIDSMVAVRAFLKSRRSRVWMPEYLTSLRITDRRHGVGANRNHGWIYPPCTVTRAIQDVLVSRKVVVIPELTVGLQPVSSAIVAQKGAR